jgi:hypothetical protein
MATKKLNSRSPYYVVAAGADGSVIENASISISGPDTGVTNSNITLSVVANNFTPTEYLWTGGALAGNTTKEPEFTESSDGDVTYGVTATDSAGNTYTATKPVSWSANTQYTATLTVANNIVGPSAGYTIGGDLNNAVKTGESGDAYSFTTTLVLNSGYTADSALAISPSQPISANFASSNVTATTTLTGTVSLNAEYYLARSTSNVYEGDTFTITLNTVGVPDNTNVPFTITGVQAADLQRGNLTGSFTVISNEATQSFQPVSDLAAESDETFKLTLDNITQDSAAVDISVVISDANTNQALATKVSQLSYNSNTEACASGTPTADVYYGLATNQSFGSGVILYADSLLSQPYTSSGDYYKIGTSGSFYGVIGETNPGEITNYAECPTTPTEENVGGGTQNVTSSIAISSQSSSTVGTGGEDPCNLQTDDVAYFTGTINNGTQLFSNQDRTSPFGGDGLWYKLLIPNASGTLVDWYARILSSPSGEIDKLTQCGYNPTGEDVDTGNTLPPTVIVSASTEDGVDIHNAFKSQKVIITAAIANISSPSYQWYKGTSSSGGTGALSSISGETTDELKINYGGEAQTATGSVYYNCKVTSSGTATEDTENYLITWDTRPSFTLKFADTEFASNTACTSGTQKTIWGDRNGTSSFCGATKFYSNEEGLSSPALSPGSYSDSTSGTNNNYRYIEANGLPQGCVTYGCAGPPASQPSTGTIQKLRARRCDDSTKTEYFLLDGITYTDPTNYIIDVQDVGQSGGRGCYQLIQEFAKTDTLPAGYLTLSASDLVRQQPYTDCDQCQGTTVIEEPEAPVIVYYYARFIDCGGAGGTITAVRSTGPISTALVIKTSNNICKEYLDNVEITDAPDISTFTTFFGCTACLATITPVAPPTISNFYTYGDCETDGGDILKVYGSLTSLGTNYPAVILDNGICMVFKSTAGSASSINLANLIHYPDCTSCNEAVNPTPGPAPDPTPVTNKFTVSSATESTSTAACSNISVFDVKLAYAGTLQDGTYLYTNDTFTNLYTPTSNTFVKSNTGYSFRIGVNNPGEVTNLTVC